MTNYPASEDTPTQLPTDYQTGDPFPADVANNLSGAATQLEKKVGIGASNAAAAANGAILSKKNDGTTAWQSNTTLGIPDGAKTMGSVVHAADPNVARPVGYASVTWIGTVAPANALINDIWYSLGS